MLPLLLPARLNWAVGFDAALPPTTTAPSGSPCRPSGRPAAGSPRGGFASEEITGPRKAGAGRVQQGTGEDVGFLNARHLFAEALHIRAIRVGAGGREVGAVVNRIDCAQRIRRCQNAVQPHRCSLQASTRATFSAWRRSETQPTTCRRSTPSWRLSVWQAIKHQVRQAA